MAEIEDLIKMDTPEVQWAEHQDLLKKMEENIGKQREKGKRRRWNI